MNSNFRCCVLSLSLLVGIAAPAAAIASSTDDRITQLERISNAQGQLLTQLQQQLSDSQRDIDSLRGQIQTNQYQLEQIVERQKIILQQIDELSSKGASSSASASNSASAGSAPTGTSSSPAASTGNEKQDYDNAVAMVNDKAKTDSAISAFQDFIKRYPKSSYQSNANYWLGQLFYNKGKKDDASYYYATVVKSYPKSPKASESMLKVGIIMQEKGDKASAKAVYQRVVSLYPDTAIAKQAEKRLSGL